MPVIQQDGNFLFGPRARVKPDIHPDSPATHGLGSATKWREPMGLLPLPLLLLEALPMQVPQANCSGWC
jgi:hypothetical protein